MKKNILYLVLLVLGLELMSCSLEEDPKFTYNPDAVFDSKTTVESAIMECYGHLANVYGRSILFPTVSNGTMVSRVSANEEARSSAYDTDIEGKELATCYRSLSKAIDDSNRVIEGLKKSKSLTEDFKNESIGQALFIRGYAYYLFATLWGKAVIRTTPVEGKENSLYVGLSSRTDVYAQAEADWREAAERLPQKRQILGKAYKDVANAYLAKLYFMLASQKQAGLETSNYATAKELWEKVIEYGKKVEDREVLESNYADLFGTVSLSKEILFQLNYTSSGVKGIRKNWHNVFAPYYYSYNAKNIGNTDSYRTIVMDRAFYDYHVGTHPRDKRIETIYLTDYRKEVKYDFEVERRVLSYPFVLDQEVDVKKEGKKIISKELISERVINGRDFMKPGSDPRNPEYDFTNIIKGSDKEKVYDTWSNIKYGIMSDKLFPYCGKNADKNSVNGYDTNNVILFRKADLLLIMADAYNEIGNGSEADRYINLVLNRAGLSDVSSMSKEDRRNFIFFERMFELAGEPVLFEDVRRRGTEYLKKVIELHNNSHFVNYRYELETKENIKTPFIAIIINNKDLNDNFLRKNLLLPIPQEEIRLNDNISQADQNFGYN